jgi:drug/metabolite transporter (DMT)-like permease
MSIFGVSLIVLGRAATGEGPTVGGGSLFGDLLVLCGSVLWAVYTILLIPYTKRVSGWWITALTITGGSAILALVGARDIARVNWTALPTAAWGAILYSGLGGLVVGYMLWYYGVRMLGPVRTALYGNLQPFIALLVAWLMLGEMPTTWQAVGAGTIVSGVLLTRVPATEAT